MRTLCENAPRVPHDSHGASDLSDNAMSQTSSDSGLSTDVSDRAQERAQEWCLPLESGYSGAVNGSRERKGRRVIESKPEGAMTCNPIVEGGAPDGALLNTVCRGDAALMPQDAVGCTSAILGEHLTRRKLGNRRSGPTKHPLPRPVSTPNNPQLEWPLE